tara:strand:+ start:603 stop:743 length:141 start_codon:yes stop_codon:yes gene_type:complete
MSKTLHKILKYIRSMLEEEVQTLEMELETKKMLIIALENELDSIST